MVVMDVCFMKLTKFCLIKSFGTDSSISLVITTHVIADVTDCSGENILH
jgi:hypothetical protein